MNRILAKRRLKQILAVKAHIQRLKDAEYEAVWGSKIRAHGTPGVVSPMQIDIVVEPEEKPNGEV